MLCRAKGMEGGLLLRLCVPKSFSEKGMRACHHDITAEHLGLTRTLQKIHARYFWPGMGPCKWSRRQAEEELEYVTKAFTDQLVALIRMKKWRKATEKLKEILDLDPANRHPPLF